MNGIFKSLSKQALTNIENQLSNNEVSTDGELIDFFIEALELTLEQAEFAVSLRDQYQGHGPLHQQEAQVFDPITQSFN